MRYMTVNCDGCGACTSIGAAEEGVVGVHVRVEISGAFKSAGLMVRQGPGSGEMVNALPNMMNLRPGGEMVLDLCDYCAAKLPIGLVVKRHDK